MAELNIFIGLIGIGAGFAIAYWLKGKIAFQKIKAADLYNIQFGWYTSLWLRRVP